MRTSVPGVMPLRTCRRFLIEEPSQVGEARRFVAALGASLELDEIRCGKLSIIASEMATNILKHAGRGEILIRPTVSGDALGVEMLAIDRGPGIADLDRSFSDGFTTGSTLGQGLGAMRRLSDIFDISSQAGKGTCILSTVCASDSQGESAYEFGGLNVPYPGEDMCGDSWAIVESEGHFSALVVDGLGHGPSAATAAGEAVQGFIEGHHIAIDMLLQNLNGRLRSTRGAAVFLCKQNAGSDDLVFAGVGNIRASIWHEGKTKGLISQNGTAGVQMKPVRPLSEKLAVGAILVLASDGLSSRWALDGYPGLVTRHPSLIAAVLYRDFSRGTDDATVMVVRRTR